MKFKKLEKIDVELSAIGLGCMGMTHAYGNRDDAESIATLHRALDLGINFWDTADMYGKGSNEELISKVLVPNRDKVFIATKFGFRYDFDNNVYFDGSPAHIQEAVEGSLKRLKIDTIDLYYAHRIDPNIPVEEMVGAMAELVGQGKVRYLGLSEASPSSIRRAYAVYPIAALQSEYSMMTRGVEKEIIPLCKELGITFVPFSPLVRGLLTNTVNRTHFAENDFRKSHPRFSDEHWENNHQLSVDFSKMAAEKNCTPAQLALAWVMAGGDHIIPIPGTKKRRYLEENAGAVDVELSANELKAIDDLLARYPNVGERYNPQFAKYIDR